MALIVISGLPSKQEQAKSVLHLSSIASVIPLSHNKDLKLLLLAGGSQADVIAATAAAMAACDMAPVQGQLSEKAVAALLASAAAASEPATAAASRPRYRPYVSHASAVARPIFKAPQ